MKIASKNTSFHSYSDSELVSVPVTSPMLAKEWTITLSYEIDGDTYLFLFKKPKTDNKDNAHIFKINSDGSLGEMIYCDYWPEAWTTALTYKVSGGTYLFLLMKSGYDSYGNNVCIRKINQNGLDSPPSYKGGWTEGWTTALTYRAGGSTYLFLLKESGYGSDGNNVHIHTVDSRIGDRVASYKWSEGWTTAQTYKQSENSFLLQGGGEY